MAMRAFYLAGVDVSRWVNSVPAVVASTGEYGQVTITQLPQILARDTTQFWDQRAERSPFYGASSLNGYGARVTIGSQTVFDGYVKGLTSDGETATVTLQGTLQKTLEGGCTFVGELFTPAELARQILANYLIPWDPASFAAAQAYYSANSVVCSISQTSPKSSILQVLEAIAQIGCARIYSLNGIVYFDVYQVRTGAPVVTVTDRPPTRMTLWQRPVVTAVEKDRCTGVVVQWVGSPDYSINPASASVRTMSANTAALVQVNTLQSALILGNLWYSYLNRPQQRVEIGVPAWLGKDLRLGFPVGIDYTLYPAPITIDLVQIDPGNPLQTMVTGLTR